MYLGEPPTEIWDAFEIPPAPLRRPLGFRPERRTSAVRAGRSRHGGARVRIRVMASEWLGVSG